jgi:transmembrane sensor
VEEFLRVSALHRALSRELKADPTWLADVLAEASTAPDNVVRISDAPEPRVRTRAPRRGAAFWAAAAAAVLAVAVGTLVGINSLSTVTGEGERYATEIGEQRRVVLPDGSGVQLNTDTELRLLFSEELRQVTLVRGEAIFDVEKDPARPFRVISGTAVVEAIGTRFNVYRKQDQIVVTVVEGRVAVSPAVDEPAGVAEEPVGGAPSSAVELDAGTAVTVTEDGTFDEPAPADVERATSWTRRRMIFEDDTLDTVVTEFNRYNVDPIVVTDPTLGDRRITGIFNIDDPDAFVALLAGLDQIGVERRSDGSMAVYRVEDL